MHRLSQLVPAALLVKLRGIAGARRTRAWGLRLAALLVLFGLFGFLAVPPLIHHRAEQALSQLLNRPVTIGAISFNPYSLSLEADRVRIGEPGGQGEFVDLGEFLVRGSWTSLFRLKPVIREVFLARLQLKIVRSDAQTFNFSDLVERFSEPSAPQPPGKPVLFSVSNIHMDDGRIDFDDRLLGQQHSVDHIQLSIPFIANLPSKVDIFSQPMLQASVDGSAVLIEGKTKPFNGSFNSDVRVRLEQLDLPRLMSYAPSRLRLQLAQGRLSTDLDIRFAMSGERASVELSGTADLNELELLDAGARPLFKLDALHVAAGSVEPLLDVVHLDELRIDHPVLALSRDRQGTLNLLSLAPPPAAPKPAPPKAPTASAAPFDFSLKHLALNDGSISVQDQQTGASLGLSKLALTLNGFSTTATQPGHYSLQTSVDQGGTLSSSGTLVLAQGRLEADANVEQLALAPFQPYLAAVLNAHLGAGTASAKLAVKANWSGPAFGLQVADSTLRLDDLLLDTGNKASPPIALAHAAADIRRFDLAERSAELSAVDIQGLRINAERTGDGSLDLLKLLKPARSGASSAAPHPAHKDKADAADKPWTYSIERIELGQSALSFADSTQQKPVAVSLSALQLKLLHLGSDLAKPLQIEGSAAFQKKGSIKFGGTATLAPLQLKLQVDGRLLDAAALEPFFTAQLNASLASALLNLSGEFRLAGGQGVDKSGFRAGYTGNAGAVNVRLLDKATSDLFAGWRSLDLAGIKAGYDPLGTQVQIGRITLDDFYSRILLNGDGRLNFEDLVVKEDTQNKSLTRASQPPAAAPAPAPAPAAAAPAAGAAPALMLGFGQILLHRGKIDYSDNFIKPNFSAHLIGIEGQVGAFGTGTAQPAPVTVQATLNDNGPVIINGSINPLVKPAFLDLTATTRGVDLSNFTSYSLKYAGYPIVKGKLDVDLHYRLDQNKLDANNHIFIDQFTFGDHVDSPSATDLPVRLAISLLKNSRGQIDVDIPVSGSLDDPQFSVGSLIWHAFLNLIEKAVTSPFSLLAGAFGGSEELGYVAFEPGSAALPEAEAKKLETLNKALADRPGVKLDLIGRVDPVLDTPGLKAAAVDRQVKAQKIRDLVGKGESVDIDSVALDPGEYDKYLERAYQAARIAKPRNVVGIARSIPPDQMKQLLLDSTTVSDADLTALAQRRASVVQQWFAGKIDPERIFPVAPKLDAAGISDHGPSTRVEFKLK
jgi:hypothetical protein